MVLIRCFHCSREIELDSKPARGDECPGCASDLKVCLNCRFYDPAAHNQCREPVAESVAVKDRANFCEHFECAEPRDVRDESEAMKKLEDLFK